MAKGGRRRVACVARSLASYQVQVKFKFKYKYKAHKFKFKFKTAGKKAHKLQRPTHCPLPHHRQGSEDTHTLGETA